jgi:hypothetical protein
LFALAFGTACAKHAKGKQEWEENVSFFFQNNTQDRNRKGELCQEL